jgi:hypothetical protein
MADDVVRVTGDVLRVDHREGVSNAGKPYSFDTAQVLVGGLGLCSVDVTAPEHKAVIKAGVFIDISATLSVFGGRATLRPIDAFPVVAPASRKADAAA